MNDLETIETSTTKARILLAAAVICALAFCWFMVRWQLGNMLASLTPSSDANAVQIAELSSSLAPADPVGKWLRASVGDVMDPEQAKAAIGYFEETVRLAPNDYRWRIELGRAYEQNEMTEKAAASFKEAVRLAPHYASPRWTLGNFYLRHDRSDEALAELKKAAENNQQFRDQVFSLAWDIFDKDPAMVESLAGDKTEAKARLAYFFAARGQAADSLRNWNLLTEAEKAANPDTAKAIAHGLFIKRYFPQSLEFSRQAGIDIEAEFETITNGSFEKGVNDDKDSRFTWQIARNDSKFEVAAESKVKREGNRSLKITFRNFNKPALSNLFQTVVVQPGTRYRLSVWVRTENLRSGGGPLIELMNANDDTLLQRSEPFPTGTNDWTEVALDFFAPANCNGVIIRTARAYCGEECPITGVIWYDDFSLSRL